MTGKNPPATEWGLVDSGIGKFKAGCRQLPSSKAARMLGRVRGLNFILAFVFGLMSRKLMRLAKKRDVTYSFLFVRPDGEQLAEIGELLKAERIRPVIDKVFPFEQAKDALEYLARGRAKGKVVVKVK